MTDTNGVTNRDLMLEMRADLKDLRRDVTDVKAQMGSFVTSKELIGWVFGASGVVLGIVRLFF